MSIILSNETSLDDAVPSESNYLSKHDIGPNGTILTIRGFKRENVGQGDQAETKTCMYFLEEGFKPLVVNQVNKELLKAILGGKTVGDVKGKKIVVYFDPNITFGKQVTGGLRIRAVPIPQSPPAAPEAPNMGDLDDIPF